MAEKFVVTLTAEERQHLTQLTTTGKGAAATLTHARILLQADAASTAGGYTDADIATAVSVSLATIARVRKTFVEHGLEAALQRRPPTGRQFRKLDGAQEAHLIAVACGVPPEGHARWTLQLLADKLVQLEIVDSISPECVRATLKKNDLKPWRKEQWVIPPKGNADFVCAMEDVLEVYQQPYDPKRPQVCVDEASKQLVGETRTPLPAEPGQPLREDYEYERCGTANLFMLFEPLAGQRHVKVTQRRTAVDFAYVLRDLVDVHYPDADMIVLVMDNLNTHKVASLYEAFEPAEARRLIEKLEIHYTPKHGSWLNMAETELSVLSRQCLNRRIADQGTLVYEVAIWQDQRNEGVCKVHWQFTTADARVKLHRLYPSIEVG
jgi:transposase